MKKILIFSISCLLLLSSCAKRQKILTQAEYDSLSEDDKRKVEHALDGIDVIDPDLEITLFASEPMMTNPTNMDIDSRGRVWICEGYNYRNQLNPNNPYQPKGDRILIMEDTDKDGKADKSTVFYQGEDINSALGIAVLGNKVIVSCSPNVFVFTDENGDDKPDKKEVMFNHLSGFQHDHAIHSFAFGPDGKLYFTGGNEIKGLYRGDSVEIKDDLGRPLSSYKEGKVFRCNVDGSDVEILGSNFRNNYESAVDSYGRIWQSDNDDDGNKGTRINYVMDYGNYGYKDEMTGANWRERRTNWESEIPKRHWHLNDPGVVPNLLQTGAGSPTGMLVYEGDLLPKKYRNQVIHCDAGPNVVRMYPTEKDGAGFKASIQSILEAANRDKWFRPSDVSVAPDGSIFVADWYDPGVGGHALGDTTRGRIYRIAPIGEKYEVPKYDYTNIESCIEALQNPNSAIRYSAWTKLHELQGKAEDALKEVWESDDSRMRARALWLLGKIKGKEKQYIEEAAKDSDEDIRMTAIRLARETAGDFVYLYKQLANDESAQVRREVALALHHNQSKDAPEVWAILASKYDGKDRWYLEALGIAADAQWDKFMPIWLEKIGTKWQTDKAAQDIVWRSRSTDNIVRLVELIKSSKDSAQLRYFRALDFQKNPEKTKILFDLLKNPNNSSQTTTLVFKHLDVESARQLPEFNKLLPQFVTNIQSPVDFLDIVKKYQLKDQSKRLTDMAFAYADSSLGIEAAKLQVKIHGAGVFREMATSKDTTLAKKAIGLFGQADDEPVTNELIKLFSNKKLPKNIREQAAWAMYGWESEEKLWELVKANKFPEDLMPIAKTILTGTWHSDIRTAATKMFGAEMASDLGNISDLVKLKGDATKGSKVFENYCQACHQVGSKGISFGPALSEIGSKLSKEGLYSAIINPSQGISFGYENYVLKMKDGSEQQGLLLSKTENEVNLKQMGGSQASFKRSVIKSMTEQKESVMPKFPLQKQEIVDLVEYLQGLKKK